MSDNRHPEWQAMRFNGQILAIYKLPGSTWRYLRKNGEKQTFPTAEAARNAARDHALNLLFPVMRGTIEPTDKDVAEKLGVAEWLQSKRADVKAQTTFHRPGKKKVIVMTGKAMA